MKGGGEGIKGKEKEIVGCFPLLLFSPFLLLYYCLIHFAFRGEAFPFFSLPLLVCGNLFGRGLIDRKRKGKGKGGWFVVLLFMGIRERRGWKEGKEKQQDSFFPFPSSTSPPPAAALINSVRYWKFRRRETQIPFLSPTPFLCPNLKYS